MSEHEPIAVQGYYPLYTTEEAANSASPDATSHTHEFNEVTYYMPDGLIDGETFWHGDYTGNDSDPVEGVPSNDRIKISELVGGGSAQLNDEFIVSRENESFRISLDDIIQAVIDDARLQVPPSNDTPPDTDFCVGGLIDTLSVTSNDTGNGMNSYGDGTFPDYDHDKHIVIASSMNGVIVPVSADSSGGAAGPRSGDKGSKYWMLPDANDPTKGSGTVRVQDFYSGTANATVDFSRFTRASATGCGGGTSGTASSTSNTESTSTGGLIDAVMTSSSAQSPSHRYTDYDQNTQTVVIVVEADNSDDPVTLQSVPVIESVGAPFQPNGALEIISNTKIGAGPASNRTTEFYIWIRPNGQVYQYGGYGNKSVGLLRFTKGSV